MDIDRIHIKFRIIHFLTVLVSNICNIHPIKILCFVILRGIKMRNFQFWSLHLATSNKKTF